jgi:hypothetical protein
VTSAAATSGIAMSGAPLIAAAAMAPPKKSRFQRNVNASLM